MDDKETNTTPPKDGEAAEPARARSNSAAGTDERPATSSEGEGATGPDGAPRKRRRRGRRGGKRHRRKPASTTAEGAEAGSSESKDASGDKPKDASGEKDAPKPRAPRSSGGSRSRASAATKDRAAGSESSGSTDAAPASESSKEDGAEDGAADDKPKRRRGRRGGARRRKPAAASAGGEKDDGATKDDGVKKAEPEKKPAARRQGSTRLAARAQRRDQRPRRRPRRLSEEEARALRGNALTMLIHEHDERTQIAVLEEGTLIEHYVARKGGKTSLAGNIFLGKVQNVLPGMEAAFVDFGRGRNGVLYAGEVNYSPEDLEGDAQRIEKVLRNGQSLMVQVTKDPIGTKGARLTTQISLPGRYMVLAPEQQLTGISRRLADKERARLRQILRDIRPNGHGVIVRTAAEGASREALERDLANLLKIWEQVQKGAKRHKAPHLLYAEPALVTKVIRDIFSGDFERIVVDDRGVFEDISKYLRDSGPDLMEKVSLHDGPLPVFEEYRVTEQLHKALERKVWLPSGGSIVIDRTEAMTVIDVNTGKFTGKGTNLEDTVFKNNVEAAEEIARSLRLRDIGGIIVIDFIDMIDPKNQQEVIRTLKRALARDKTRSQVFDVTNLGLVEMTRKKVSEGLLDAFSEPCPNCVGRGIVITHEID